MRIGILLKDIESLSNWELRIIKNLRENPRFNIVVLILDGRVGKEDPKNLKSRLNRLFRSGKFLGTLLFKTQTFIEKKMFKELVTVDRNDCFSYLKTIDSLDFHPKRKGFSDFFSEDDVQKLKNYDLDLILRHGFNIIRGKILEDASKYGVWSFHHADNRIYRGSPVGFWEIVRKEPSVGVTLQKLTRELDGGKVIDKAHFNRHWSFVKTNHVVLEGSVSLLMKNLEKLADGKISSTSSPVYYNPLFKAPGLLYVSKYCFQFYGNLFVKVWDKFLYKFLGVRSTCWTLFIGKGDFMNATLFRLKPIELPKTEFWADPFLFNHKGDYYVFFENYPYTTKRGKISCGRLENNKIIDVCDVLDFKYHLSYPYIFEEDGEIYLMPETSENKRLEIYKCLDFPGKWELYATAFEGEEVFDAHFHTDQHNIKWLFVNKRIDEANNWDSELFIYQVSSLKLENLIPHAQNPVLIDARTARNGGSIFKYGNDYYRPSQRNVDGVYGRALNINKIVTLNLECYEEEQEVIVEPNFRDGLISMHHLHQVDDLFVFDAAYRRK